MNRDDSTEQGTSVSEARSEKLQRATAKYINDGPHYMDGCCVRCGKKLREVVGLELDQRIDEYHDFNDVPESESQGWFNFGPDCAKVLRERAARKRAEQAA